LPPGEGGRWFPSGGLGGPPTSLLPQRGGAGISLPGVWGCPPTNNPACDRRRVLVQFLRWLHDHPGLNLRPRLSAARPLAAATASYCAYLAPSSSSASSCSARWQSPLT